MFQQKKYPKCFKCKCDVKDNKFLTIENKKLYYHLHCLDADILFHCLMLISENCDEDEIQKEQIKNKIQICYSNN